MTQCTFKQPEILCFHLVGIFNMFNTCKEITTITNFLYVFYFFFYFSINTADRHKCMASSKVFKFYGICKINHIYKMHQSSEESPALILTGTVVKPCFDCRKFKKMYKFETFETRICHILILSTRNTFML